MRSMTDGQIITELSQAVGPTLTALAAGIMDRSTLRDAATDRVELVHGARIRLALAHELFNDVAEARGDDSARAWFIGANTGPTHMSPAEAIRDGHFEAVRSSARRFCDREEMGA